MTTNNPFPPPDPDGWTPDLDPAPGAAEVVDLDKARNRRTDTDQPTTDTDDATEDSDNADEDAESLTARPEQVGPPVDPPDDGPRPVGGQRRAPILPAWAHSRADIAATARHAVGNAGYAARFHAVRTPKYAAKVAVWAPIGFLRTIGRLLRWATAEEGNWALRQDAARRNDPETWLKLDRQRQRQTSTRWPILIGGTLAALVVAAMVWFGPTPAPVRWLVFLAVVVACARLGRPADRPITDRVATGETYRKLTAELVRRALTSLGIAGINSAVAKNPGAISFPVEIHRDGPGHLAIVDLPYGVEAGEVIARRGRLASGLRLPLDQVWPDPAPGHTGRLALWVGYQPASQMRQPAWPLIRSGSVDVFKPFPFATTPRLNVVTVSLIFRNWLFGGQPGSGKTFALRLLVLAAALDPRVEIRGYELKGVGDFAGTAPVLSEYGNGFDEDTLEACAAMLKWLYDECRRRSERIAFYAAAGKAPENKVTPELASLKDSGLHPLVAFIDEIQELFHSPWGKEAAEYAEKVIKLGRALGVTLLIGTQIPDKDSLPPGITRNVNSRFCLSVADQVANDMILGTSMYKQGYRATAFEPVVEAGWGILAGFGKPSADRSYPVTGPELDRVIARAVELRTAAGTLPTPAEQTRTTTPSADVVVDVAAVWPAGEGKAWNETLCARLADLRPDVYGGWESVQLTAALKPHGITPVDVGRRIDGKAVTRRGISHTAVLAVVAERDRKRRAD
ncbi:cell division protein FtsK [Frankia sp. AgB32]|uniref:cell division protein FtsK n=1 Tax=Frankia sp. AgB32 TaxID=631119 RepID=UPI00200F79F9|nr:cell division protein FtsK [Frankia sp. AgB32]MCK9894772.1 cell division protein FtsK [Frankia sp. AgB32]